ncbi:MAG: hypothetical protein FWB90_01715 [Fibromonadales bacterium]|nr:hypothetical protein [Fibromonadales bacterium]
MKTLFAAALAFAATAFASDFYEQIAVYRTAENDVLIELDQNITLEELVYIPTPAMPGIKLTIRSNNATIARGISGNLFTVSIGATLKLEDVIIDGDGGGGGSLIMVSNGGALEMFSGAVLRNNYADNGGGVYVANGKFTMSGGKISGNTAAFGGGVYLVGNSGEFAMWGGEISENTATYGNGVYVLEGAFQGTFSIYSGVVSGIGINTTAVIYGPYNLNSGPPGSGVVIARNPDPSNDYIEGQDAFLTVLPKTATAVWAIKDGKHGIFYRSNINGNREGFVEIPSVTVIMEGNVTVTATTVEEFYNRIATYAIAKNDMIIEVSQNLTLDQLITIPPPITAGRTLTIRSSNATEPVTIKRGISGDLFTVPEGATLILEDIIIDGDKNVLFGSNGSLVSVNGTFIMNDGAVIRNNNDGHGVYLYGGAFTMYGGKISENNNSGASIMGIGVYLSDGTFTMYGGEISDNIPKGLYRWDWGAGYSWGGGVYVANGKFTMSGGKISGNVAAFGGGVYGAPFTITSGIIIGTGASISDILSGVYGYSDSCIIVAWNKPTGASPFIYIEGTDSNLIVTENATVLWAIEDDKFGISYKNGENIGFIEIPDIKVEQRTSVTFKPAIAKSANAHVPKYYTIKGEPLGSQKPTASGIYILKIGNQILRVPVK